MENSQELGRSPALKALRQKIQQRNDSADLNL